MITAAGERIYIWDATGGPLRGLARAARPVAGQLRPFRAAEGAQAPQVRVPRDAGRRAALEGPGEPLDIVVPGLDGRLRAYRPDGTPVPGFPVRLIDPDLPANEKMTAESINNPAIGDLDGDGRDDIVVATNEVYGGGGLGGGDVSFGGLLAAAGSTSRVYAVKSNGTNAAGGPFLPGWPVKPGGIIQNVLPLIGPGHDPALVKVGGTQKVVVSVTGGALALYGVDGSGQEIQQNGAPSEGSLNLFESAAVGQHRRGRRARSREIPGRPRPGRQPAAGGPERALQPPHRRLRRPTRAAKAPGFPVITDDYQFLSSSTIAKVAEGVSNQIVAGTGLGLLHAYDGVTRPRRRRLPQGNRRLAVRPGGVE